MESVTPILLPYGYLLLFVGLMIDALGFPFPCDIVLFSAAYLVSQGAMSIAIAAPVAFAAVLEAVEKAGGKRHSFQVKRIKEGRQEVRNTILACCRLPKEN